jgi:hypothetical protein
MAQLYDLFERQFGHRYQIQRRLGRSGLPMFF